MKAYELQLPVFKQGDDLHNCMSQNPGDLRAAFELQAARYDEAARMCRRMAGVASEVPCLEVDADTHMIAVNGPAEQLESLAREGLLAVSDYGHDEFEDDGSEDELEVEDLDVVDD